MGNFKTSTILNIKYAYNKINGASNAMQFSVILPDSPKF